MKNFDDPEPEGAAPQGLVPAGRPHVEIIGDPARISEQFRKAALAPAIAANKHIRESLRLTSLEGAHERVIKAAVGNLRTIELPKIDWPALVGEVPQKIDLSAHMMPRVEPLKIDIPKPPPRVVPADIAGTAAVNAQTDAIVALHHGIEDLANRSDNRTAWVVWLTAGIAFMTVLILFDIFLR